MMKMSDIYLRTPKGNRLHFVLQVATSHESVLHNVSELENLMTFTQLIVLTRNRISHQYIRFIESLWPFGLWIWTTINKFSTTAVLEFFNVFSYLVLLLCFIQGQLPFRNSSWRYSQQLTGIWRYRLRDY